MVELLCLAVQGVCQRSSLLFGRRPAARCWRSRSGRAARCRRTARWRETRAPPAGWPGPGRVAKRSSRRPRRRSATPSSTGACRPGCRAARCGRPIFQTKAARDICRQRATSSRRGSTAAKPCTVASSTGHIAPKATTNSTMPGLRPKIEIASGNSAEAGSGRMNSSVGCSQARTAGETPISAPSSTPNSEASSQPSSMRPTVAQREAQELAVAIAVEVEAFGEARERGLRRGQEDAADPAGAGSPPTTARSARRARRPSRASRRARAACVRSGAASLRRPHASRHRALQAQHRRVDDKADDADPDQPGRASAPGRGSAARSSSRSPCRSDWRRSRP